ncbi:MAG: hypothetical protein U5K31_09465 [Balneolaceae bacterium]|nr:hypothetical protein [Balneolaceae bacterium]
MDEQPTLTGRMGSITYGFNSYPGTPTGSMQRQYEIAAFQFGPIYDRVECFLQSQMPALQRQMDQLDAPWTPERLPDWMGAIDRPAIPARPRLACRGRLSGGGRGSAGPPPP